MPPIGMGDVEGHDHLPITLCDLSAALSNLLAEALASGRSMLLSQDRDTDCALQMADQRQALLSLCSQTSSFVRQTPDVSLTDPDSLPFDTMQA